MTLSSFESTVNVTRSDFIEVVVAVGDADGDDDSNGYCNTTTSSEKKRPKKKKAAKQQEPKPDVFKPSYDELF